MAAPFATRTDYTARGYDASKFETAAVLDMRLAAASRLVRAQCPCVDDALAADPPTLDAALVADVVCAMVLRSVPADSLAGLETEQTTMGPFSQSRRPSNPFGDFYLTKSEKRSLGCGGQRAGSVQMGPRDCDPADIPWWVTA